jgi:hypothetical protein
MKGLLTRGCIQVTDDERGEREEDVDEERGDFMAADYRKHEASLWKPRGLTSPRAGSMLAVLRMPVAAWDGRSEVVAVPRLLWSENDRMWPQERMTMCEKEVLVIRTRDHPQIYHHKSL